jgi:NAD(P)-dependent dehydrogenase (short-subunit alcohol dehydrogenase family)
MAVTVSGRRQARLATVVEEVTAAGGRALAVTADLLEEGAPQRLVDTTVTHFGRVDVLVNNAGAGQAAPSETLPMTEFRRIIDLDLVAPFACAQAAGRVMLAQGRGVIVNVSSLFGHLGIAGRAAYAAAKHGLEGLTKVLAVEWASRGVRVTAVAPGYVATELVAGTMAAGAFSLDDVTGRTPLRRLAQPLEVARAVAFLASEEASYITGASLMVDGGWTADGGWRTT